MALHKGQGTLKERFTSYTSLEKHIDRICGWNNPDAESVLSFKTNDFTIAEADGTIYLKVGSEKKNHKEIEEKIEGILDSHAKNTPDHSWVAHHSNDDFMVAALHLDLLDRDKRNLLIRMIIAKTGIAQEMLSHDQMVEIAKKFDLVSNAGKGLDGYGAGL